MALKDLFEGFVQIDQQVEAIHNLNGTWSALFGPFGITSGAVAGNGFYAYMFFEPPGHLLVGAIWQQIHDPMAFQVHQDRPIVMPFAHGTYL